MQRSSVTHLVMTSALVLGGATCPMAMMQPMPPTGGEPTEPPAPTPPTPPPPPPRVYGDGSAGARVIDQNTDFKDANLQFTDFTIMPGVTMTIESGAVIRCTGTFMNQGTIVVRTGAEGGRHVGFGTTTDGTSQPAVEGIATIAAGNGAIGEVIRAKTGGGGG